jgi:acyl carrier protein
MMFSELGLAETRSVEADSDESILELLAVTPEGDRLAVIAASIGHVVAAVFDCATTDFESDDMLDDIGLDSMMAMEFRLRINMMFSIDLPVLEILRGVSVNSLSDRILAELHSIHGEVPAEHEDSPRQPQASAAVDEVEQLMGELSDVELRALLAELETQPEPEAGGAQS